MKNRDLAEVIRLGAGRDLLQAWDALESLLLAVEVALSVDELHELPTDLRDCATYARRSVDYCRGVRGPDEVAIDAQVNAFLKRPYREDGK